MFDRESLRQLAVNVPRAEIPTLLGALAEAAAVANMRLLERDEMPAQPSDGDQLVDAESMAELLSVPEHWVRDHARRGLIPSHKVGHYVRFRPADVIAVVAQDSGS